MTHPPVPAPNRDLLAACWTWAGNAGPFIGDEVSPLDLGTRIEAVAAAGWNGVGFIHADLPQIKAAGGFAEVKKRLDDNGLVHVELEFLSDWWKTGEARAISDRWRAVLFDAAEALEAKTIKIGAELSGHPVDEEAFYREFDALSTEAGEHGTRVALEPMAMNSLGTIERGARFIREVGNPHGGLTVDIWHVYRGGTDYSDLARILPMEHVFLVEIDDALDHPVAPLWEDAINERLYPGEGQLNVSAFVAAMTRAGWTGHWGVEMLSDKHRTSPLPLAVRRARETAAAAIEEAAALLAQR